MNWQAGGGFAWDKVCRDSAVRDRINEWLAKLTTPYEFTVQYFTTLDDLTPLYQKHIETLAQASREDSKIKNIWEPIYDVIHELKKNQSNIARITRLAMVDRRTDTIVSPRDVGVGISQILPVLVAAYGTQGCLHAIEQPEIHLHPALQAELGDVFIESALGENKNTFLLETHSEHLILRILRRIRETTAGIVPKDKQPIRPEDVQVLYIQPTERGSVVRELPVSPDGDFLEQWPEGFFEERVKDLF
jgi:predicted ATPase